MSAREAARKSVFVIGGGYGGIRAAKNLDKEFNVLLFERKNYFCNNVGNLRSVTQPSWVYNNLLPYSKLLTNGAVVKAEVESVNTTGIKVRGLEQSLKFDYLVLATGTAYAFPAKVAKPEMSEAKAFYESAAEQLKDRKRVLIIGGGPVGCELAGEIKAVYPNTEVTIVHMGDRLLNPKMPPKLTQPLQAKLKSIGVNLILNDSVDVQENEETNIIDGTAKYKTGKGKEVEVDIVYKCFGAKVNNGIYQSTFDTDGANRIKVNGYLQVEGQKNIFAVGDCAAVVGEPGMAYYADLHGACVAKNITALENGGNMESYKSGGYSAMMVPLGPKLGQSLLPIAGGLVLGNWPTKMIKGGNLFSKANAGKLNVPWPDSKPLDIKPDISAERKKTAASALPAEVLDVLIPA